MFKVIKKKPVLFCILTLAVILRFVLSIQKEFFPDELYGLVASTNIFKNGYAAQPSGTYYVLGGPIVYIHALIIKLFGYTEGWVRLPGLICSFFGLWFFYRVGRQIFESKIALLALLLAALDIDLITWGAAYTKPYSVTPAIVFIILYLLAKDHKSTESKHLWVINILVIIGIWIHPLFVLFIPGFAFVYLLLNPDINFKSLFLHIIILSLGILGIYFINYISNPGLSTSATQVAKNHTLNSLSVGHIFNFLINLVAPQDFSSNVLKKLLLVPYLSVLLGSLLYLANSFKRIFKHSKRIRMIIALCVFLLSGITLHMLLPSYHFSYILPLMPVFYLLASAGLVALLRAEWVSTIFENNLKRNTHFFGFPNLALGTFVLLVLGLTASNYINALKNEGWKNPYSYVNRNWHHGDAILQSNALTYAFAVGPKPAMYYYTEHPGIGIHKTNQGMKDLFANSPWIGDSLTLIKTIKKHQRVWFISQPGSEYNNTHFKNTHQVIESELRPVYKYKNYIVYLKEN